MKTSQGVAVILLAGYYRDQDSGRQEDFLECIRRNVDNDHIAEVHLFVEYAVAANALRKEHSALDGEKIRLVPHGRRVRFSDLFEYANRRLAGQRVIIANADICFDETLARLDGVDLTGKLLCLSRWDLQSDGSAHFFDRAFSQDAWIFRSPIRVFRSDFYLGLLGCDGRLAWEAERAGLELHNPGRYVRALHLHLSGVYRYTRGQCLKGPTRGVPSDDFLALAGITADESSVQRRKTSLGSRYRRLRVDKNIEYHLVCMQQTLGEWLEMEDTTNHPFIRMLQALRNSRPYSTFKRLFRR
jgi:hypothetical protein